MFLPTDRITAATYFVKSGGTGDGRSWSRPFGELQPALAVARAGDEIWVAGGEYLPTSSTDRNIAFVVPDGVRVLGGFKGGEQQHSQRDWERYPTVLSGNIGHVDSVADNSYTIVQFERASTETVLDGFTLTGANADSLLSGLHTSIAGGAVYNDGRGGVSSPVIRNCRFVGNRARRGGAVLNYADKGICRPRIENCAFEDNRADFNGGALLNVGDGGLCNPEIKDCRFVGNRANYGGALFNRAAGGECLPRLVKTLFRGNWTNMSGAVLFNRRSGRDRVFTHLTDCTIEENFPSVGPEVVDNGLSAARAAGVK